LRRVLLLALFLFLYEPFTSLFAYLPPLLAYGAWRTVFGRHWVERLIWVVYFYLFEADHAFAPLSLMLSLAVYWMVMRRFGALVACRVCLYLAGVPLFYLIVVGVQLFYTHILGIESDIAFWRLLVYMVWDLVLVYAI